MAEVINRNELQFVVITASEAPKSCKTQDRVDKLDSTAASELENVPDKSEVQKDSVGEEKVSVTCSDCGKEFTRLTYLKLHMRIHTGERPYSCKVCEKTFYDQSGLNRHLRIHNGVRPYRCKYCGKTFRQSTHMASHEKSHEYSGDFRQDADVLMKAPLQKPFKCDLCSQRFITRSQVKRHFMIHTGEKPYQCQFCDSKCRTKGTLTIHERTHTGEKPFPCTFCQKSFVSSSGQKLHERSHTGEKPYSCDFCGKTFAQMSNKTSHVSRCHKNQDLVTEKFQHPNSEMKRDFKCSDCDRLFALEMSLQLHTEICHGDNGGENIILSLS